MAIIIFGDSFSFPEGNASTNRVFTYAKGFTENNIKCYVICFSNDYLKKGYGVIDKIEYFHPLNRIYRSNSFLTRNWFKFKKYFNTIKVIKNISERNRVSAIIIYTTRSSTQIFSYLLAKMIRAKLVVENSEHPLRYYRKGIFRNFIGEIKLKIQLTTLNGILLITHDLMDFYESRLKSSKNLLLVPSTVDPSRFEIPKSGIMPYKYIGYFGSIDFDRDNVDLLLKAYSNIHLKHEEIHLVLGGILLPEDERELNQLLDSLQIKNKVHVLGYMKREEIVKYFVNADLLVLVRRNDKDTEASFPCKLTEYLATGNPIISVKVGEIPLYLKDKQNIFLTSPENVNELSEKIDFVLSNYQYASEVAKKGKELADSIFNYSFQAKRIINFINSL